MLPIKMHLSYIDHFRIFSFSHKTKNIYYLHDFKSTNHFSSEYIKSIIVNRYTWVLMYFQKSSPYSYTSYIIMYNCHTESHVDLQLGNVFSVVENIFRQHLFAYFYCEIYDRRIELHGRFINLSRIYKIQRFSSCISILII